MTRADGFAVMDVSTDVVDDPKFRRIARTDSALVAPAFMAYMAVVAESWKAGRRIALAEVWPALLPLDGRVEPAMTEAALLDNRGMVPVKTWNGWFKAAAERRDKARERWRRANLKRDQPNGNDSADTSLQPRGNRDDTAPLPRLPRRTAPSAPSVPPAPAEVAREVEDEEPEFEALQWLGRHGCYIRPGDGYHQKLILVVGKFGVNRVVGTFDRLARAGILDGDVKGFVFGAHDQLFPKADLKALDREDAADDARHRFDRGVERTRRETARLRGESA